MRNEKTYLDSPKIAEPEPPDMEIVDSNTIKDNQLEYKWASYDNKTFETNVDFIYEKVVYWRKNLFLLPTGKAGKSYIDEITRLMNECLRNSPLKRIAFKVIVIMPNLLLQKPSKCSKSKEHLKALKRRLLSWYTGDLIEQFREGETIQQSLKSINSKKTIAAISKQFAEQMQKGHVNGAMKLLTNNMQNGILPLNDTTFNQLKLKHPEANKADEMVLLPDLRIKVHPVKFESIDAELVRKAAIKTRGGSGPSGMDADGWRRMLTSKSFSKASSDLCKAFGEVIKSLCVEENLSSSLEAFLACRLILLDKKPGLRPIGVGEILRRIAGKVVVSVIREDIITSVGSLQVCSGHEAGCEAAVHAMHDIFEEENTEAVLPSTLLTEMSSFTMCS